MAGLCAAARARELGTDVRLIEKGTGPGGSMLLSSCVVWRYRTLDDFRAECPGGDPALQALVIERLDEGLEWLRSLGAPVVWEETGNPRTVGLRFDPRGLTEALVRAAGDPIQVTQCYLADEPIVLATGGFQADPLLVAEHITSEPLALRANRWSTGDGLRLGLERGGELSAGMDEFYGRNMPARPFSEQEFVPLAQLYGRWARIYNERGEEFFPGEVSWSENDLVQATARQPGACAWYVVDGQALERRIRDRSVRDVVETSGTAIPSRELPFDSPEGLAVHVRAAITHTIGGLRIDERARVADGVWAAGADAGGISTGGYASGLAAALVFGRIAAEDATL